MTEQTNVRYKIPLIIGCIGMITLFGVIGGWMYQANIAGAVISSGTVIVKGKPQAIQHMDGGIIKKIYVNNGDQIKKGDKLLELDATAINANYQIYLSRIKDAITRKARLLAEREGRETIDWHVDLPTPLALGDLSSPRRGQQSLFDARRISRSGVISQSKEKIKQLINQAEGVAGAKKAREKQVALIDRELKGLTHLHKKGLTSVSRVLALERNRAELMGEVSSQISEAARIQNSIQEIEINILQVERDFREKVEVELREVTSQINELVQQIIVTREQMGRIVLNAPIDGVVHELNVFTVGGVIPPGATVMQLIAQQGVDIEVNVESQYRDRVSVGQKVAVRFPAFNQETTPELYGKVGVISPSNIVDEQTGASFYRTEVLLPPKELKRLDGKKLVPGMPVEAYVTTDNRTVLSYFLKPFIDQYKKAFRER